MAVHNFLRRTHDAMKQRCYNEKNPKYANYGGRGISITPRWLGKGGYTHFVSDVGDLYREGLTLDRIDNDGNYELGNVRWATANEQLTNTRRNRRITIAGVEKTMSQWIEGSSVKSSTVRQRFYVYNWPIELALGMGG